jgi:hypothetical protein
MAILQIRKKKTFPRVIYAGLIKFSFPTMDIIPHRISTSLQTLLTNLFFFRQRQALRQCHVIDKGKNMSSKTRKTKNAAVKAKEVAGLNFAVIIGYGSNFTITRYYGHQYKIIASWNTDAL